MTTMREELDRLFRVTQNVVPNDMDSGALVVASEEGDHILFIQKPERVTIPRFEVNISMEVPEELRKKQLDEAIGGRVEALLLAALNLRADLRAEGTGSMPVVPERMVIGELEAQLRPHKLKWLCATGDDARVAAQRLATDGLEVIGRWGCGEPDGAIIGMADTVGCRLPMRTHVMGSSGGSYEFTDMGWLVYPGRIAIVEVCP